MNLQLQSFSTLVQNMAAAVQSAANTVLDVSVGSVTRAVLEANASVALWLQWLVLQVLRTTRASTSAGPDLDSWMADFSVTRLPATPASGLITLARITPGTAAVIPVGTLVRTADGTQSFTVQEDSTSQSWLPNGAGYGLPAGALSVSLPVTAVIPGSAGNIQANTITQLATAVPGIDSVANPLPLSGGRDSESDAALRARFQTFIQSRSLATPLAVANAIASVQQGLTFVVAENVDSAGSPRPGNFVLTVNDGTGTPSAALLAIVQAAVDAVRPIGATFAVQPPQLVSASVQLSIQTGTGALKSTAVASVTSGIASHVAALPIGAGLSITRLAQLAFDADPSIVNVTGIVINGEAQDLSPPASGVIQLSSVSVV